MAIIKAVSFASIGKNPILNHLNQKQISHLYKYFYTLCQRSGPELNKITDRKIVF